MAFPPLRVLSGAVVNDADVAEGDGRPDLVASPFFDGDTRPPKLQRVDPVGSAVRAHPGVVIQACRSRQPAQRAA